MASQIDSVCFEGARLLLTRRIFGHVTLGKLANRGRVAKRLAVCCRVTAARHVSKQPAGFLASFLGGKAPMPSNGKATGPTMPIPVLDHVRPHAGGFHPNAKTG